MNPFDLSSIPFFHGFPREGLNVLESIFETERKPAGATLISEEEPGDQLYILVQGKVRITKRMFSTDVQIPFIEHGGSHKVLATVDHSSYPVFGEIALIDRDSRSASITVVEDSEFLVTTRDRVFSLIEREPVIGNHLLIALCKRLAATIRRNNNELVKLTTALALALTPRG